MLSCTTCLEFTVSLLDSGNFEVGVHIADVSYFVEQNNDLDAVASQRATSVYLVQKVSFPFKHSDNEWPVLVVVVVVVVVVEGVCCLSGDPHVAQAALRGAVQSEPSHRQAHLLCHLDAHTRGTGMTARPIRAALPVPPLAIWPCSPVCLTGSTSLARPCRS